MPTLAGQMQTGTPANPQWVPADGRTYYVNDILRAQRTAIPGTPSQGHRGDYLRNVGWQGRRWGLGMNGWLIGVPYDPTATYKVALADDNTETTLTSPPTVAKPPPGIK